VRKASADDKPFTPHQETQAPEPAPAPNPPAPPKPLKRVEQ